MPFACAAFTNLTQDHLDFHNDMESYFKTKARLFLELPRAEKALAVNADDPWGRRLLELCPRALSFGLQQGPPRRRHLWGELLSAGTDGCHLRMHLKGRTWELRSPLVGAFNASNLLTVQALALEMGLEPEQFVALEGFTGVCGRLERVNNPQGLNVFVDYAHTPDALVNVLKALRGAGFKRIITVCGCGGNRDRSKRPLMGEAVARYADVAVLTSDNPRFEEPQAILQDVLPGLREAREVLVEVDRRTATARALDMLDKDGALLIAGKGHEDYQIMRGHGQPRGAPRRALCLRAGRAGGRPRLRGQCRGAGRGGRAGLASFAGDGRAGASGGRHGSRSGPIGVALARQNQGQGGVRHRYGGQDDAQGSPGPGTGRARQNRTQRHEPQ